MAPTKHSRTSCFANGCSNPANGFQAALEQIRSLDVPWSEREQLESNVLVIFTESLPREMLDQMTGELSNDRYPIFMRFAEAVKWMDARINQGAFDAKSLDGRSLAHVALEIYLIDQLLVSEPEGKAAFAKRHGWGQ